MEFLWLLEYDSLKFLILLMLSVNVNENIIFSSKQLFKMYFNIWTIGLLKLIVYLLLNVLNLRSLNYD